MEEDEDISKLTERLKESREKAYERRLENEKKRRERRIVKTNKIIENIAQEILSNKPVPKTPVIPNVIPGEKSTLKTITTLNPLRPATTPKIQIDLKETSQKTTTKNRGRKKNKPMSTEEKRAYEREKKRKQREKIKANPEALEKAREYERKRNQKRREEGKFKKISQLNQRQQRAQRKKWRQNTKIYLMRKKMKLNDTAIEKSPQVRLSNKNSPTSCVSSNKKVGRKLVRRDRCKLFRQLEVEKKKFRSMEALMERWKKRYYKASKKKL